MRNLLCLTLLVAASCSPPAQHNQPASQATAVNGMSVSGAWAAPTPGGVDVSAGYLIVSNGQSTDDRLIAASSPRAREVQLHDMTMDAQMVMQMRQLQSIDIPAGGLLIFGPGGKHLMFTGVLTPFAEGDQIPLRLTFEHAGNVDVTLPVRRGPPS